MRVLLTGGSGFVGSNLARVFGARGADVVAPSHAELDLTDRAATLRAVDAAAPDAIVHAAILNDPAAMAADKARAWDAYVGATGRDAIGINRRTGGGWATGYTGRFDGPPFTPRKPMPSVDC